MLGLHLYSKQTLYEALKVLHGIEGTYSAIVKIVEFLVTEGGEQPNERLYEALIRANVDPMYGSAGIARSLLSEMEDKGIPTSLSIYHAVLEVSRDNHPVALSFDLGFTWRLTRSLNRSPLCTPTTSYAPTYSDT